MREAQVTKDIVRDLLPVYLAGDASADTRAVVESFLAGDQELRQIVDAARSYSLPPLEAPANLEVRALQRTRRLLGRKNFWLGFALIFCSAPLVLKPFWLADIVMVIGLAGWIPFLFTCRELSATGLEPPRGRVPFVLWALVGFLVGSAASNLWNRERYLLPVVTSGIALLAGRRFRQFQAPDQFDRPTTLFGKQ